MKFLAFIFTIAFLAQPLHAEESSRTITIIGHGEVTVAPDMATVSVGVETSDATARDAMQANSAAMAAVVAAIRQKSIESRDIQTSALNLSQRWERIRNNSNNEPKFIGYTASNVVTIRVRDLKSVGPVLDAVTSTGANQIHSLSFGLQDNSDLLDRVRILAVKDAMRKAALYAEAAGVVVGNILSIDEAGTVPSFQPGFGEERMMIEEPAPIEAGELSLSAEIKIVLEIR